jgi:ubiquinone biosynthesis protein
MLNPFKQYRTLSRSRHIFFILSKHGFGELIGWLKIKAWWRKTTPTGRPVLSRAKRFRMMLEELGPTFIKFGQLLSTRSDLLPADFLEELVCLQDRVTPVPWKYMKWRFEHAGINIDETFSDFDTTPIASASLAQVYAATLKTGEKVAVKILKPNIEDTISADLSVLGWFAARLTQHLEEAKRWEPEGIIREFRNSITKELDLRHEGRNADIFRNNFADDPTVYVPKIYWSLSSRAILVMEFIDGKRLIDCFDPAVPIELRRKIAVNGAQAVLKQIFLHGFFQADPHPGNGFVLDDGVICWLDFGMFARVDQDSLLYIAQGLYATINKDAERLVKATRAIGMITDESETDQLKLALIDLVDQYHGLPLKQIVLGKLLAEVVQIIRLNKLRLRSNLMMLVKSISTIESVGRNLDPDFDIIAHAEPFIKNILTRQHSPGRILDAAVNLGEDITTFIRSAPDNMLQIMKKMKDGHFKIDFMHKGLEGPVNELNRMIDKLILGIVTGALLIASSLIVQTGKGPQLFGYSAVGIVGFFAAGFLVLWITVDIFRRR